MEGYKFIREATNDLSMLEFMFENETNRAVKDGRFILYWQGDDLMIDFEIGKISYAVRREKANYKLYRMIKC